MKRKIIPYNPHLTEIARNLRNNSTLSEVLLWNKLKNKKMLGYDFHRQKPLHNYIVDFFCHELMLAVEVDGSIHVIDHISINDLERQKELENIGIRFLRFSNDEVKEDLYNVVRTIENWIIQNQE